MQTDIFRRLIESSKAKKQDYTTYQIAQKVNEIILQANVTPKEMHAEINKLPDVNDIKTLKKTVQLLFKSGFLNKENLALVTSKTNFEYTAAINGILNHLLNADLLNQDNLDWILTSDLNLGPFSFKVDILAKNSLLTKKTLLALKSGKIKNLPDCILLMQEAGQLTPKIKDHISTCGDIASELGINPFKLNPTWVSVPSLENKNAISISDPVNNAVCASSFLDLNNFLLAVNFTLGLIVKGKSAFSVSPTSGVANSHRTYLEKTDRIVEDLNAAIEKYQDKPSKIQSKVFLPKNNMSHFFNKSASNDSVKEEATEQQENIIIMKP